MLLLRTECKVAAFHSLVRIQREAGQVYVEGADLVRRAVVPHLLLDVAGVVLELYLVWSQRLRDFLDFLLILLFGRRFFRWNLLLLCFLLLLLLLLQKLLSC